MLPRTGGWDAGGSSGLSGWDARGPSGLSGHTWTQEGLRLQVAVPESISSLERDAGNKGGEEEEEGVEEEEEERRKRRKVGRRVGGGWGGNMCHQCHQCDTVTCGIQACQYCVCYCWSPPLCVSPFLMWSATLSVEFSVVVNLQSADQLVWLVLSFICIVIIYGFDQTCYCAFLEFLLVSTLYSSVTCANIVPSK